MMPSVLGQRYGDGGITTTQLAADGECQAIGVYTMDQMGSDMGTKLLQLRLRLHKAEAF